MLVVAITKLVTDVETEARALAVDLKGAPYDFRLKLNAGVPAIVLVTAEDARAIALLATIRARGHAAVRVDTAQVTAPEKMVALRRPRFEAGALFTERSRLGWDDIACLVRATHRWTTELDEDVTQSKLSIGRAVVTGGLVMRKTTTSTVTKRTDHIEQVLYLFPRTAELPWILREQDAHYDVLGAERSASSTHNFARLIDALRTRVRGAVFDDRLLARRGGPTEIALLAHLVAGSLDGTVAPFR